jgi:signal transduction histidine kinase
MSLNGEIMKTNIRIVLVSVLAGFITFVFLTCIVSYLTPVSGFVNAFFTNVMKHDLTLRLAASLFVILLFVLAAFLLKRKGPVAGTIDLPDVETIRSEFINNLSYELVTPIHAIIGFSDLLLNPDLATILREKYIHYVHKDAQSLLQLVNDIIDYSKIESNCLKIDEKPCKINSVLEKTYEFFESEKVGHKKPNIELLLSMDNMDDDFTILTDETRLRQIFRHLFDNALKYTDKGNIEIGYKLKGTSHIQFFIRDTGKGISPEKQKALFSRPFHSSDRTTKFYDGAGLGLFLSFNILKLMDGRLWLDEKQKNGSAFYFEIPLKVVKEGSASVSKKFMPRRNYNWSDKKILIAEDVESNFLVLKEILRTTEANLIWVKNGKEAFEYVQNNEPVDLILMDILMPVMDGFEATKKIRSLQNGHKIPVVAQTAYSLEGEKDNEMAGFDDCITKPIWSQDLLNLVAKFLNK